MVFYSSLGFLIICFALQLNVGYNFETTLQPIFSKPKRAYYYPHTALFEDEESIIKYLKQEMTKQPKLANDILAAYHSCFKSSIRPQKNVTRRPFIVIESNNLLRRQRVATYLTEVMGDVYLQVPPKCMWQLAHRFVRGGMVKCAFYQLSLYAAAHEVKQIWASGRGVVMNGYWYGQAAYIIELMHKRSHVPPRNFMIYNPPHDLLTPDLLIVINHYHTTEHSFYTTSPPWVMSKFFRIFNNFNKPQAKTIYSAGNIDDVIIQVEDTIQKQLGGKFDLRESMAHNTGKDTSPLKLRTIVRYKNLEEILHIFHLKKGPYSHRIKAVLQSFKECFDAPDVEIPENNRKPFIVVEGNVRRSKRMMAKIYAKKIGAKFLMVPPQCLADYTKIFQGGSHLKYAFYFMSMYVIAYQVRQLLANDTAVVVNGYYTEQMAFLLNQNFDTNEQLPLPSSKYYQYPDDLLKPDMLFYLYTPICQAIDIPLYVKLWNDKVIHIYSLFNEFRMAVVNTELGFGNTTDEMLYHTEQALCEEFTLPKPTKAPKFYSGFMMGQNAFKYL